MKIQTKEYRIDQMETLKILTPEDRRFIEGLFDNPDPWIRSRIPLILMAAQDDWGVTSMCRLLQDPDGLVRTEVYDSFAAFPYPKVLAELDHAIQTEADPLARSYAIYSWADLLVTMEKITEPALNFARQNLNQTTDRFVRLGWVYALLRLGDPSGCEKILKLLSDSDYHVRCSAIAILDDLIDVRTCPDMYGSLQELLSTERVPAVRERAIALLEKSRAKTDSV